MTTARKCPALPLEPAVDAPRTECLHLSKAGIEGLARALAVDWAAVRPRLSRPDTSRRENR